MARYTGPKNRLARREGFDLYLKSVQGKQLARDFVPGQHGQNQRGKTSNYGLQLREKQKVKRIYGILERQFRGYFKIAARSKGVTGTELLRLLESRLDNVVYRSGFANTRAAARQMVCHGAVQVNGRKVDIPSFRVKAEDKIRLKVKPERAKKIQKAFEDLKESIAEDWLAVDSKQLESAVKRMPDRQDVKFPVEEQLIVELYSK